jgi:polysaccharide pyruvyl transferase WcaK-like protein
MHYPEDLDILRLTTSKMTSRAYIVKNKYTAAQLLGIIKRLDLMVGMRLHSLIYASTLSVPVIGLVYEPKVEGFINYIEQFSAGNVQTLDYEKLRDLIVNVLNNKEEAKAHLKKIVAPLKLKALENARIAVDLLDDGSGNSGK